jgi:hypothetical protein
VTGEEVFLAWAPDGARWSPWVKPVLFAHVDRLLSDDEPPPAPAVLPPGWQQGLVTRGTALLIELPGPEAVSAGAAAADLGFQPVPLFNALPGPPGGRSFPEASLDLRGHSDIRTWCLAKRGPIPIAAVDVGATVRALVAAAPRLRGGGVRGRGLPPDAPPAFLVDARRHASRGPLVLGRFDNRSAHSMSDFPSAERLRAGGVERVVLLADRRPGWDLLPMLAHWRAGGIAVELRRLEAGGPPQPYPPFWAAWFLRPLGWIHRLGLHGNGRRGFGGWSAPSAG